MMNKLLPLDEMVELAAHLRGTDMRTLSIEDVRRRLKELFSGYSFHGLGRDWHQVWFRGRICERPDGFENLWEMIYPPATREYGRANVPGRSVFYASWNVITVLNEIGIQSGQLVQVIGARPAPGRAEVPCTVLGEYSHIIHSGRARISAIQIERVVEQQLATVDDDTQSKVLFLDSFLSEEYRRLRSKLYEHKLTATFAEMIYESSGGVMYPSVETYGGENLAVSSQMFDERFEVLWTWLIRVEKYHGYGVYSTTPLKFSCDFDADGRVNWESKKEYVFTHHRRLGNHLPAEGYVGWRPV